ncbi:hypothetical protein P5P81_03335 [Tritonibacter mobilis]|nr:hypothetical protein [Tritonibacter mobilis]
MSDMANKIEGENNLTHKGRGRPKGSQNKTTATAKAIIEDAADRLGGADRLVAWAQEAPENERAFWATIYPKLLPLQVNAKVATTVIRKTVYEAKPD